MTDREDQQAMDLVERAAAALRDVRVPAGPPPEIVASMVEALRALDTSPEVIRRNARRELMFRIGRYSGIAAAISLLVIGGWFLFSNSGPGLAFAEMIEKVKKAESVNFVWTEDPPGGAVYTVRIHSSDFRCDVVGTGKHLGTGPLRTIVFDTARNEWVTLDHQAKTFQRDNSSFQREWQKTMSSLVECLRKLKPEDGKLIGREQEEGCKLSVYEVNRPDLLAPRITGPVVMKAWVDERTGLPIRIRAECASNNNPNDRGVIVVKELTWNQPVDPTVFKTDVPDGYRVIK